MDEFPAVRDAVHSATDIEFFRASRNRELVLERFGAESTLRPAPTVSNALDLPRAAAATNYEAAQDARGRRGGPR